MFFGLCTFLLATLSWTVMDIPDTLRVIKDVPYAHVEARTLHLDLYIPEHPPSPFLIVWVHGGAWRSGSKEDVPMAFSEAGFATASIEYRLSGEARFPAQIHDIKAAIRFLRANASEYGYRGEHIAIAGSSAGGHLVALVGTTNGHAELEGTLGDYRDTSSDVQAVIDYYGPTNFMTILHQSTPHGLEVRVPALELLLGDRPEAVPTLASLASPTAHVDAGDPPLLIFHGDQDPQVPINQSHELHGAYKQYGLDVTFEVIHGAGHGGGVFFDEKHHNQALDFLKRTLKE